MKKISKGKAFFSRFFIMAIIINSGLVYSSGAEQTAFRSGEVSLKKVEPFVYFCLRQKGPFTEIEKTINQLIQTARSQNVFPAGPLIAIFISDPAQTKPEEMEWEVGFPVTPQALVQAPLEKKTWDFTSVAACIHTGPYDTTGETVQKILAWMEENGYIPAGPVLETYLDMDPSRIRPQDLRTEIWIPCQRKSTI